MYKEIDGIPVINMTRESYQEALRQSRFRGCAGIKGITLTPDRKKVNKKWHTHFGDKNE
ncbi:MAG: hypothetical protein ACRCWM_02365 [Sarcina sp.]